MLLPCTKRKYGATTPDDFTISQQHSRDLDPMWAISVSRQFEQDRCMLVVSDCVQSSTTGGDDACCGWDSVVSNWLAKTLLVMNGLMMGVMDGSVNEIVDSIVD